MTGDSYNGKYGEDERLPTHYDIDPDYGSENDDDEGRFDPCFGQLEEIIVKADGFPDKVYYVCADCGTEIPGEVVVNHDRDIADWEMDYEPYY